MSEQSKASRIAGGIVRYLVATVSLSVLFYVLFALFFSTAEEKALQRENTLYKNLYPTLVAKEELVADAIEALEMRDNEIYMELFETPAPSLDPVTAVDIIADNDSLSESFYLSAASSKTGSLMLMAGSVDESFREIFEALQARPDSIPPLSMPLMDVSYVQVGASVGMKHNPVTGLQLYHRGLDLIAPLGQDVLAAADGVVSNVTNSRRGLGNIVEIDHGNGYVTRYCLLGEVSVQSGRRVKCGQKVGTVGMHASFGAAHLHFEILHNGEVEDPVDYLFASVSAADYARIMYMSVATTQSMD